MDKKIYIAIVSSVFFVIAAFFCLLPHPGYSEMEKRDLTPFPSFSWEALASGEFTNGINKWFSDSEPYRDVFLTSSMWFKDFQRVSLSDDDVTFHVSSGGATPDVEPEPTAEELEDMERNVGEYKNNVTANENATIANKGIIVVGKGDKTRALMAFGGSSRGGVEYANAANEYKKAFPDVNVYCMVIPTAVAFYCPEKVKNKTTDERLTINNIHSHLMTNVHAVDIYSALGAHAAEDIYLRTDHHWAPLGAYYAAQRFCSVAKVPFKPIDNYERKVVHRYVGSMYSYSKDIAIKNNPEDFVYHVPKDVTYTTTYTDYTINSDYQVTGEGKPYNGIFFYKYKDGAGGAYCTFMGGDTRITKVHTSTKSKRRLLILKDSFGNALPGYLFYSFEEIHVVDYRYFTKNMRQYVRDNKITDILFANNIFNAYSAKICKRYVNFLNQKGGIYASAKKAEGATESMHKKEALRDSVTHSATH